MLEPNEYIKKYGLLSAKNYAYLIKDLEVSKHYREHSDKLERIIKSHDLVEEFGGLDKVKLKYSQRPFDLAWSDLKQAIDDVESCL